MMMSWATGILKQMKASSVPFRFVQQYARIERPIWSCTATNLLAYLVALPLVSLAQLATSTIRWASAMNLAVKVGSELVQSVGDNARHNTSHVVVPFVFLKVKAVRPMYSTK